MESAIITELGTLVSSEESWESVRSASVSNSDSNLPICFNDVGEKVSSHPRVEPQAVGNSGGGNHLPKSGLPPT